MYRRQISSYLKEMLVGQVIARVELEYEDVVHTSLSPAVRVDAQQEQELNEQKTTSINSYQRPDVICSFCNQLYHTYICANMIDLLKRQISRNQGDKV